jgi:hypothetical protein
MPEPLAPPLPWTGENINVKLLIDNQPQPGPSALIKSLKITEDAVIHEDEYLGQKRTRYDKQIKGYGVAIESDTANMVLVDALMARDAAREANQRIPEIGLTFSAVDRTTGQTVGYFLTGIEGKWDLGFDGRTERVKTSLEYKASNFKKSA